MTPLDVAIVHRKLRRIRANVDALQNAVASIEIERFRADELRRRAVERLLQETIDAAVDVNNHLLRGMSRTPAEDYYSSFIELGRAGVLEPSLATALAPAAGLRNRIVHEYEELDDAIVLQAAQSKPAILTEYVAAIERFLEDRAD